LVNQSINQSSFISSLSERKPAQTWKQRYTAIVLWKPVLHFSTYEWQANYN